MPSNFERLSIVIADCERRANKRGEDFDQSVKDRLKDLTGEYKLLGSKQRKPIDYSRPGIHGAYAFRTMGAHAEWLRKAWVGIGRHTKALLERDKITIANLCGGPGTEILAIASWALSHGFEGELRFITLDVENKWKHLRDAVAGTFNGEVDIARTLIALDLTDKGNWTDDWSFCKADVITCCYGLSEVWSFNGNGCVDAFFEELKARMKPGAIFLYVDNLGNDFTPNVERLFEGDKNFKAISNWDDDEARLPAKEQISSLGEYLNRFGESPKLRGEIAIRAWKKI